jgi:hypothetical protein
VALGSRYLPGYNESNLLARPANKRQTAILNTIAAHRLGIRPRRLENAMLRFRLWVLLFLCTTGAFVALTPSPSGGADKEDTPDAVIPIASSIEPLFGVTLNLPGADDKNPEKLTVSLVYARKGAVVFPLPAFVVVGQPRLLIGHDRVETRDCAARDALLPADAADRPVRLKVKLVNLLGEAGTRKAVYAYLRQELVETGQTVRFAQPDAKWDSFRATLCAPGAGSNLPQVVELSEARLVPRTVAQEGGEIDVELLPAAVAALGAAKGETVTLAHAYLRTTARSGPASSSSSTRRASWRSAKP